MTRASIIAVLQLTGIVLSYLNDSKILSKDQARLMVEASNICSLLTSLRFLVEKTGNSNELASLLSIFLELMTGRLNR